LNSIVQTKVLGKRYEIVRFIGQGGFGDTYLARDRFKPVNSQCVIKQLKPKSTDPNTLEAAQRLFEREVQFLYKLGKHDRIPQLLDHFEEDRQFYLVQEFVDGDDLSNMFNRGDRMDETAIIAMLVDVLETLQFVHANQVVHRDIKPSNLIHRRQDDKFVVIDFGSVKQVSAQQVAGGITSLTIAIGTPGYMPLEQQSGKPRFSSDIYALGMTAIHGLTGMAPHQLQEEYNTGEILWQSHCPQLNIHLASILHKMVRSHYRDRYQQVEDVLSDLQKLQKSNNNQLSQLSRLGQLGQLGQIASDLTRFKTRFKLPLPRSPKIWYFLAPITGVILLAISISRFVPSQTTQNPPPSSTASLVTEGNRLFHAGKYTEAIDVYDRALNGNPENPTQVWVSRGITLSKLEKFEESIASYDRALAISPNDASALDNKGFSFWKLMRLDDAIAIYTKALSIAPQNTTTWNNRAVALIDLKKYDEALKDIDKSIEIAPDLFDSWNLRGEVMLYGLKRYEEAVLAYDRAIRIQPNSPFAWRYRGESLSRLQRYQEAIFSCEEALKNKPDFPEAWLSKAFALSQLNKQEEAIASVDRALQYRDNYSDAWFAKGILLAKLGRYKEAVAAYDKSLALKPDEQIVRDARKKALEKL
jgi:serine/threonine protein kinase/regulator of sirC expression with transglutaminase-like and TPR domain